MLVVALALAFALAGVKGLQAEEPIDCSCFGNLRQRVLGWRQAALLPCWLLLAALAQWSPPSWSARQGMVAFTALVLAVAYWQVLRAVPAWRALRGDRLALGRNRGLVMVNLPAPEGTPPA